MSLTMRRPVGELERTRQGLPLLDLIIVVAVIALSSVMQFREYSLGLNKTLIIESINLLRLVQLEQVERFGMTGRFDDSQDLPAIRPGTQDEPRPARMAPRGAGRGAVVASLRDLEEADASVSRLMVASESELQSSKNNRRINSANTVVGVSAGVPTAVVKAPGMDSPMLIEFRPAVGAEGAVVNWLCGSRASPAWLIAPPARSPAVPDHQLPIPCRVTP